MTRTPHKLLYVQGARLLYTLQCVASTQPLHPETNRAAGVPRHLYGLVKPSDTRCVTPLGPTIAAVECGGGAAAGTLRVVGDIFCLQYPGVAARAACCLRPFGQLLTVGGDIGLLTQVDRPLL